MHLLSRLTAKFTAQFLKPWFLLIICSCCALLMTAAHSQDAAPVPAQPAQAVIQLPSLFASSKQLTLHEPLGVLVAPKSSSLSPAELMKNSSGDTFKAWSPGMRLPTSSTQDVWLRLVLPAAEQPQSWMLRIPRMRLNKATLHARTSQTQDTWQSTSAGMSLARASWPMPYARDPVFALTTQPGQTQLFFIQLEHPQNITENIQLIHHSDFADGANYVGTIYGLIIGAFGILTVGSLISAWIHRSAHFAWLALFCFSVMLSQLTVSGYMSVRIWPNSVLMAHIAGWVFPLLSLAALARLALSVSYARELSRSIYWSLWAVVGISILLTGVVLMMPFEASRQFLNVVYALGMFVILGSLAWIAWRSQHWLWMIVASIIPLMASVAARLAYNLGWVAHVELALLAGVITSAIGLVTIFTVLYLQQRERISAQQRLLALENTDATTGLSNERVAIARLPQVLTRSKRFERPCGAILLRWLDFDRVMRLATSAERDRIFSHLGNRLSRLSRDIDTVARMGDDQFIFLVEAPVSREQINELASKILATCMRPSAVMPDTKGFDLHLAVWLSNEVEVNADQALELLKTRIDHMRTGTQRRVQFVDSALNTGSQNEIDPAMHTAQLVAKINSLEATQGLPTIDLRPREFKSN